MRKLLLLALLLYDVIVSTTRPAHYYYEDDERRIDKKNLGHEIDFTNKDHWDSRKRHELDNYRYGPDLEGKDLDKGYEREAEIPHRVWRYDNEKPIETKSTELGHHVEKPAEKREMNCERLHERYDSCFAGCAAVSCDNPRDRLRPCYPFCESGCVCVAPYVRDDRTHKCVLPEDCTKGLKGIPDIGEETA